MTAIACLHACRALQDATATLLSCRAGSSTAAAAAAAGSSKKRTADDITARDQDDYDVPVTHINICLPAFASSCSSSSTSCSITTSCITLEVATGSTSKWLRALLAGLYEQVNHRLKSAVHPEVLCICP
jgi:hypothetical protein